MKKLVFYLCFFFCFPALALAKASYQFQASGVSGDLLSNVQNRIAIEKASLDKNPSTANLQRFIEKVPTIVRSALEPYGYFAPHVRVSVKHYRQGGLVIAVIKPGKATRVSAIDIHIQGAGKNEPIFQQYLKDLPLKTGQPFHAETYEKIKADLFKMANDSGYVQASFTNNRVYIDLDHQVAKIELTLQTGKRFYFGPVSIENGPYSEAFLRRFINFNDQTPFNSEQLVKLQQAMVNSYFFDRVLITPDIEHATKQHVPIHIAVTAPKAKRYSIGLGYGTFTGVRITAGMSLRHIGKGGQHASTQLKLSQVTSGLAFKYYLPGHNPLTDQWVLGARYQNFNPKNGRSNSATLSAGYARSLRNWQLSGNLNYLVDRYRIFNEDVVTESHFSKLLYPNFNISYTKTDDLINPSYGRYAMVNIQGASQRILSSVDFLQAETKLKLLFSPTSFGKIILRGDIGYTTVEDIKQLPMSMQFFAGGLNSVRGYADSSLGPARYLLTGSIEYQQHIYGNWDAALFYDMGNAINHWGEKLNHGEGFGIIYRSIIGPVKVYVGRAMNKADKPRSIEISIGPEF